MKPENKSLWYSIYKSSYIVIGALTLVGTLVLFSYNAYCYGPTPGGLLCGIGIGIVTLGSLITISPLLIFKHSDNLEKLLMVMPLLLWFVASSLIFSALATGSLFVAAQLGFASSLEVLAIVGAIGGAASQLLSYPIMYNEMFEQQTSYIHLLTVPIMAGVGACSMLMADALLTSLCSTAELGVLGPEVMAYAYVVLPMGLYMTCNMIMNVILSYTGEKVTSKGA